MANRYWVGGTNSWSSTAGTKWATTSGGAGGAAVPTSSDDVFFDANSGAVTVTLTSNRPCANFNSTGFTGTIALSNQLQIYGNTTFGASTTFTGTSFVSFFATTTGKTITTNGVTISGYVDFNGVGGGWTLQGLLDCSQTIYITNGTVDFNDFDVNASAIVRTGTGTAVLSLGSGDITLFGAGTSWNFLSSTGLTLNAETSSLFFTSNYVVFRGGGFTYNDVWFTNIDNASSDLSIFDSNTFNNFYDSSGLEHNVTFDDGTTQTILSGFNVSGDVGEIVTIKSTTTATHNLVFSGTGKIDCDYLNIQHSVATPSNRWYAGLNSTNNQSVATAGSGWIFNTSASSKGGFTGFM